MKKRLLVLLAVILSAAYLSIAPLHQALAQTPTAANNATVDVTIGDDGNITIGGIDLKALGVAPLDSQALQFAKNIDSLHATVADDTVTVDIQGTQLATMDWNPQSRAAALALATRYGLALSPDVLSRIESWIASSNVDVTARISNEPSKPLNIDLSQLVLLDVANNGALAVENGPLAYGITPDAVAAIRQGGNNATLCWANGTIVATVDGQALPTITLNQEGVNVLAKALNLPVQPQTTAAVLASKAGVDVALPSGAHSPNATCE